MWLVDRVNPSPRIESRSLGISSFRHLSRTARIGATLGDCAIDRLALVTRVKHTRFGHLRKVSGRLKRILGLQDTSRDEELRTPRLLIVDDEESICFSMSEYFSLHGFNVDTARETEEAEKLVESTEYRVIIQDLRLGTTRDPDGLNIIRLAHKRYPETRIIVLTAYGSTEMEDEARRCGADAFLRKPKPLSQVAQVVQGLIESPSKQVVKSA